MPAQDDINENESCPICKMDRFLNPNLTILVSPCFHKMCESCVNRIFATGSGPCPVCKTVLRKTNFVKPVFEDMYVEKECRIRKRVRKIFNKREEDFEGDLDAYNDYLEEVEDIIFNLVNDTDVQAMNAKIEEYQRENMEQIQLNLEKEKMDHDLIEEAIEEQKSDIRKRKLADIEAERKAQETKLRQKDVLISKLADEDTSADTIIQKMREKFASESLEFKNHEENTSNLTLMGRMHRRRARIQEQKALPSNPFENPLDTPYERQEIFCFEGYHDPVAQAFDTKLCRAGGFKVSLIFEKAIEAMSAALLVGPLPETT